MNIATGTRIGKYTIEGLLGAGGMGRVYRAHDNQLDRVVAVKVLSPDLLDSEDRLRRFTQEAKSASALNHPHILTIYEIGSARLELPAGASSISGEESPPMPYIAMEYVDGDTLRNRIHRDRLDPRKLLDYLAQAADGLSKAHASGIVHRDLKPDNIMVTHDGYAKVLDFGLAKLVDTGPEPGGEGDEADTVLMEQRTLPGMVMGTVGYMSPEQVQGRAVDQRSDIFSMGCILFEAATRHRPFEGDSAIDTLHRIVYQPTPSLGEFNPEAPAELQRIIKKCLSKDVEDRYQSARELGIDLRNLVRDFDTQPVVSGVFTRTDGYRTTTTGIEAVPTTPGTSIARRLRIPLLIACAVVVGLLAWAAIPRLLDRNGIISGEPFREMRISRQTSTGDAGEAVISEDGRYIVHVVNEGGTSRIAVRQVATGSVVDIVPPGESPITGLELSPDGNYLYFVQFDRVSLLGSLYQVPVLGGTPRKILEDVDSAVSFDPTGQRIVFVRNVPGKNESQLTVSTAEGRDARVVATRSLPDYFRSPAWSPDGKTILSPVLDLKGGPAMNVVAVDAQGESEPTTVTGGWHVVSRIAWVRDGSGIIMAAADQATRLSQVWYMSLPDGRLRRITNDLNHYVGASLTKDASVLVTLKADQVANLWVVPLGDPDKARQVTSGVAHYDGISGVSWAPNDRIIYGSQAGGNPDIWALDTESRTPVRLTFDSGINVWPAVSPDGTKIAFGSSRGGNVNIWTMDINGQNPRQITSGPGESFPTWSPDGRWIVYTNFGSGTPSVWRISADGGEPQRLTERLTMVPSVSPDGKTVACFHWDDRDGTWFGVALLPLEGGEPRKLSTTGAQSSLSMTWANDGKSVMYIERKGGVSNIRSLPIGGGEGKLVTAFDSELVFSFQSSPDGKWLVCSRGTISTDVVMLTDMR